jgi:hypothetical protein
MRPVYKWLIGCGAVVVLVLGSIATFVYMVIFYGRPSEAPQEITTVKDVKVWDPEACEYMHFAPARNNFLMWLYEDDPAWKMRVVDAHIYCSRQWDHAFFAKAAKLLEENHLLITDQTPTSADIYNTMSDEKINNFLKVLDAAPMFLSPYEEFIDHMPYPPPS